MTKRAIMMLATAILTFGTACSSGGDSGTTTSPPGQTTPSSVASGNAVTISMVDFSFEPSKVTASTSQDIILTNNGSSLHNFSLEVPGAAPVDVDVPPGTSHTLAAPGPGFPPGTYTFFCKYHRSTGMTGTLTATSG